MGLNNIYAELRFYYCVSQKYYRIYNENGKIYLYAKGLYNSNKKIVSILEQIIELNMIANIEDTVSLFIHYNNWITQFELLEKEINPKADTEFVFFRQNGDIAFCHKWIENLMSMK